MFFSKKLKLLLSIFNISSRKLAKAVHVDPSSVSRWLNNKRIPAPSSSLVDKIIDFFLNLDAFEFQKDKLLQLITPENSATTINSMQIANFFREWLFSPTDITYKPDLAKYSTLIQEENQINELITYIANFPETKGLEKKRYGDIVMNHGLKKETEVFYGNEGIQQALLHLAADILQQKAPGDFIITSQNDFFSHGNPDFMVIWTDLLKDILKKGHKIKVLFNLNRGLPEVSHLIISWLPLFSTGNFEAYYYPKYVDNMINFTLAAVPGKSAICSTISADESLNGITFLHRDFSIIEYYKSKLEKLISKSKPLIYMYSSQNMLEFHEEICSIEEGQGCRFVCRNGLTSLTIPLPLYKKLLDKSNLSHAQKQKRYIIQKLRLDMLKTRTNLSTYLDICYIDAIDAMINPVGSEYYLIDIFSSGVVMAQPRDVLEHLKNTIYMLETLDNFEIALSSKNDYFGRNTMYCALKENNSAIVSTWDSQGTPVCFIIKEKTIVHEFESYFVNIWDTIPSVNRDKKWVISKLQAKINTLEKMLEC